MATSSRKKKTDQYPLDASGLIKTYKGKITSRRKIYRFFKILYTKYRLAFHPDERFGDITTYDDTPIFKKTEAKELDKIVDDCFEYCQKHKIDIYEIALEAKGKDKPAEPFDKGGLSGNDAWTGTAVEGGGGIKQPVYDKGGKTDDLPDGTKVKVKSRKFLGSPSDASTLYGRIISSSTGTGGRKVYTVESVFIKGKQLKAQVTRGDILETYGLEYPAAVSNLSKAELGKLYEKVVGYDIAEDDKAISKEGIIKMMVEYDDANREKKPFINKDGYYFKGSQKDKWVENYRGYSIVEYAPDHYGILWESDGIISYYIMDDPDFVKPGDKPATLEVTKKHIDLLEDDGGHTSEKAEDGTVLETLQTDVHSGAGATPTEMQDEVLQLADGGEVNAKAQTILEQLGGSRKLQAMTGAVIFSTTNGIQIILKSKRAPYVYIDLNGKDLYDVKFGKFLKKEMKLKMVSEFTDVQADDLKSLVEKETEMQLSLAEGGVLPEDATQSQVFAKEGTELNSSPMIPNNQASVYAAEKLPFTGTNLEGKKLLNGDYIVLSFMCYPIWLYSSADGRWYGNKDKFNTITAMHQQESRPDFNAEMIPLHELYKKLFGSIQKFDLGGPVQQLYPMSLDNALEAHG